MANTNSWAWPNIFNVSQNTVSLYEDNKSIVNRCRLLILTEPTEVYNEPNQGVGLKRYMFRYNHDNVKAEIRDRSAEQFSLHEPCVDAASTQYAKELLFTGDGLPASDLSKANKLEMTLSAQSIYGDTLNIDVNTVV